MTSLSISRTAARIPSLVLAGAAAMLVAGAAYAGADTTFAPALTKFTDFLEGSGGKIITVMSLAGGLIGLASGRFSLSQVAVPVGVGIGVGTGVPIVTSVVTAVSRSLWIGDVGLYQGQELRDEARKTAEHVNRQLIFIVCALGGLIAGPPDHTLRGKVRDAYRHKVDQLQQEDDQ